MRILPAVFLTTDEKKEMNHLSLCFLPLEGRRLVK